MWAERKTVWCVSSLVRAVEKTYQTWKIWTTMPGPANTSRRICLILVQLNLSNPQQIYILSGDKKSVLQQTDIQLCERCFPVFKTSPRWTGVDTDCSPRICLLWIGQIELDKDQANPSRSICRIRHCSPYFPHLIDISLFHRPHQTGNTSNSFPFRQHHRTYSR